LKIDKY